MKSHHIGLQDWSGVVNLRIATSCRMRDKTETARNRVFKPTIKNEEIEETREEITLNRNSSSIRSSLLKM